MSDWVIARMDVHGLRETIVVGNSLGGHIALDLAIRYPNRISSLVLTGSSGLHEHLHGASMPKRFDREYTRSIANKTFTNYAITESELDQIQSVFEDRNRLMNMLRVARSARKYDLRHRISEITQPVQLIWGMDDIITPPSVGEEFLVRLPQAELHLIEHCGHSPMLEQAEKFATLLKTFLFKNFPKVNTL
jgi:pimeloyl-ACP methyl ester carboxylesterase